MNTWPWPAPVEDSGAVHLRPGLLLPNVKLPSTSGGTVSFAVPLSRIVPGVIARAAGALITTRAVVFIYPWTGRAGLSNPPDWDLIPGAHGSTPEAEGFRDHFSAFDARGIAVYGLSSQDTDHQRELAERLRLPFPILSDANFEFADALSLPRFETGGVTYLKRLTIIIADGLIERVFYPVHPPDTHAREVLAALKTME